MSTLFLLFVDFFCLWGEHAAACLLFVKYYQSVGEMLFEGDFKIVRKLIEYMSTSLNGCCAAPYATTG